MASMGIDFNPDPTIRRLKGSGGLVNRLLQQILASEGLYKAGVKADLQDRIAERLRLYARNRDAEKFARLKMMIENPSTIPPPGASVHAPSVNGYMNFSNPPVGPPPPYSAPPQHFNAQNNMTGSTAVRGPGINFEFKTSPFFQLKEQIGETRICDTMTQHRHTVSVVIKPSAHPILARFGSDPSLKIMVFCAGDPQGRQDISFPHQSELKVNGGEIKANLRGLKNKPGSTRPVDITSALRLKLPNYANYINSVEMTYALTAKKFYMVLYVVQIVPVTDLVKKLEVGKKITAATVIRDMVSKARDTDIVATSTVLSLKCPLSTLRIDLPCRSIACKHNQCFDGTSYMQLQEQGPTWLCPICNNSAPFDSLAVDEYVQDILRKSSRSAEQVTIEPDGTWKSYEKPRDAPTNERGSMSFADDDDDDDDDLIEVLPSGQARNDAPAAYRTPSSIMAPSREQSAASSAPPRSASGKRPISAVIDLTSSGDEEDEVARAPKRQQTNIYNPPSSTVPAFRPAPPTSGYQQPY